MVLYIWYVKYVNVLYINNEYIYIQKEFEEKNIFIKN